MPNVNKAIVMSVLGRDPETKNFPNEGSVTHSAWQYRKAFLFC